MSKIPIGDGAVGVQHSVPASNNFSGELPAGTPAYVPTREVLAYPVEGGNGGGLFFPVDPLIPGPQHAFCTHVQLFSAAGFSWTVDITSGLKDGDATHVDDPLHDQELENGSGNAHVRVMRELLPGQGVRVVTTGASAIVYAIFHVTITVGSGGRVVA